MLASVTLTDERLAMLDDAGLRTLLAGVQGAAELPLVVDAFTIVYSDVAPVRLAGDLIFRSIAKRVRGADDAATKLSRELAAAIGARGGRRRRTSCARASSSTSSTATARAR